jgi:hypothetical protein
MLLPVPILPRNERKTTQQEDTKAKVCRGTEGRNRSP